MSKYCIYARKASVLQSRQGTSIAAQIEAMQICAQTKGFNIVEIFTDAKSAIDQRPQFERMLEKVSKGEIHTILCTDLDRLCRNFQSALRLMQLIEQTGLTIITKDQVYDNKTESKLLINSQMGLANFYRCELSERIKRGIQAKKLAKKKKSGV